MNKWGELLLTLAVGYAVAKFDVLSVLIHWFTEIEEIGHKRAILGSILVLTIVFWMLIFVPLERVAHWERKHTGDYPFKHPSVREQLWRRGSF